MSVIRTSPRRLSNQPVYSIDSRILWPLVEVTDEPSRDSVLKTPSGTNHHLAVDDPVVYCSSIKVIVAIYIHPRTASQGIVPRIRSVGLYARAGPVGGTGKTSRNDLSVRRAGTKKGAG